MRVTRSKRAIPTPDSTPLTPPRPAKARKISKPTLKATPTSTSDDIKPKPISKGKRALTYTPSLLPPALSFSVDDGVDHLSGRDTRFGELFKAIPCRPFHPPIEAVDPYKTLVTSIIGQQVSWMAAKAIGNRFKAHFGYDEDGFPSPMQVANAEVIKLREVGLSFRKAEYIIGLAQHFAEGKLSTALLRDGTDEEISKALIAVRGIGQWTVDMFLMFSLRRPDVLPVGDLGVQKGLLRWALAAHGALPKSKSKANEETRKKYGLEVKEHVDNQGRGEVDTRILTPPPEDQSQQSSTPQTPQTPQAASLVTAASYVPPTPITPSNESTVKPTEVVQVPANELPGKVGNNFLDPPVGSTFDSHSAVPLVEGLTIDVLKSRLAGKKAKGGVYLTAKEMEGLTNHWRPYRSMASYYMWPLGEDF